VPCSQRLNRRRQETLDERPVGSAQALAHGTSSRAEVSERDWHVSSEDRCGAAAVYQALQNVVDVGGRDFWEMSSGRTA